MNEDLRAGVAEAVASMGVTDDDHPAQEEQTGDSGFISEDEPSFDPQTPESRHWQSVADRLIAKKTSEMEERFKGLEQKLTAQQLKESREPVDNQPQLDDLVSFDTTTLPNIPSRHLASILDDDTLKELDQRAAQIGIHVAKQVLGNVAAYNQRASQEFQAKTVEQKLTGFIGTLSQEQARSFMPLYDQYRQLADSDPDAFVDFAKVKLNIGAKGNGLQSRQNLAGAVQATSTRPTSNGNARPRVQQAPNMRNGVAQAVEAALRRTGG